METFNKINNRSEIPKFGLNFIKDPKLNDSFLLLCGFEKFKEYFVRIDIFRKTFYKNFRQN